MSLVPEYINKTTRSFFSWIVNTIPLYEVLFTRTERMFQFRGSWFTDWNKFASTEWLVKSCLEDWFWDCKYGNPITETKVKSISAPNGNMYEVFFQWRHLKPSFSLQHHVMYEGAVTCKFHNQVQKMSHFWFSTSHCAILEVSIK